MKIPILLSIFFMGFPFFTASMVFAEPLVESRQPDSNCDEQRFTQCIEEGLSGPHKEASQNWAQKFKVSIGVECVRELELKMGKEFQNLISPPWQSSGQWNSLLKALGSDPCAVKADQTIISEFDRLEGIFLKSKKDCKKKANC